MPTALTEAQIRQIEAEYPEGLTSQELVSVFSEHKIRFSEANLRRYVQLGLVPRSRRIGQKGKHLGSRGLYPVRVLRRINTIKRLMAERYTLEEIQGRFLSFKDGIETLDEAIRHLISTFQSKVDEYAESKWCQQMSAELASIRENSTELLDGVHRLEKLLIHAGGQRRPRGGGVASPTELL